MALTSTMIRFQIKVSDVDRGLYETLELRVAKHPSESEPFFFMRIIAYVLNFQEGIEFSGGIGSPDDPSVFIKDLTGQMLTWIDIGNPSGKRLHKAGKVAKNVRVYTYRDPKILLDELSHEEVYKKEAIGLYSLPPKFMNSLVETLMKDNQWEFLQNEGELSITVNDKIFSTELTQHRIYTKGTTKGTASFWFVSLVKRG